MSANNENVELLFTGNAGALLAEVRRLREEIVRMQTSAATAAGAARAAGQAAASALASTASAVRASATRLVESEKRATSEVRTQNNLRVTAARTAAAQSSAAAAQQTARVRAEATQQTAQVRAQYQQQTAAMRAYYAQQAAAARAAAVGGGGGGFGGGLQSLAGAAGFSSIGALAGSAAAFVAIGLAIKGAIELAQTFLGLIASMTSAFVTMGINTNAAFETMEIGFGSLIANFYEFKDAQGNVLSGPDSLTQGAAVAAEELKKLQVRAIQTKFTTQELGVAYQQALGGFAGAGVPLSKVLDLTVRISQAAGAIGIEGRQLNEEIRSLATGTISVVNSRLATALGITGAMVREWKAQGTLVEELTARTATFAAAGEKAQKSFEGLTSSLKDIYEVISRDATRKLYENLKVALQTAFDAVFDYGEGKFRPWVTRLVGALNNIFGAVGERIIEWTVRAIDAIENVANVVVNNQAEILSIVDGILDVIDATIDAVWGIASAFAGVTLQAGQTKEQTATIHETLVRIRAIIFGIEFTVRKIGSAVEFIVTNIDLLISPFSFMARKLDESYQSLKAMADIWASGVFDYELGPTPTPQQPGQSIFPRISFNPADYGPKPATGAVVGPVVNQALGFVNQVLGGGKDATGSPTPRPRPKAPAEGGVDKAAAKAAREYEASIRTATSFAEKLVAEADKLAKKTETYGDKLKNIQQQAIEDSATLLLYSDKKLLKEDQHLAAAKAIRDIEATQIAKLNAEASAALAKEEGALIEKNLELEGQYFTLQTRRNAIEKDALETRLRDTYGLADAEKQAETVRLAAQGKYLEALRAAQGAMDDLRDKQDAFTGATQASADRAQAAFIDNLKKSLAAAGVSADVAGQIIAGHMKLYAEQSAKAWEEKMGIAFDTVQQKGIEAAAAIAGSVTTAFEDITSAFKNDVTGQLGDGSLVDTALLQEASLLMAEYGLTVEMVNAAFGRVTLSAEEFNRRVKEIAAVRSGAQKNLFGLISTLKDLKNFITEDLLKNTLPAMAQAFANAFAQAALGAITWGQAFQKATLDALAIVAKQFGDFFMAKALGALAAQDYRGAALYTAAATAMYTLAGILSGLSAAIGAGGGGGGGETAAATEAAAGQTREKKTRAQDFNTSGERTDRQPFLFGGNRDERIVIQIESEDPLIRALLSSYRVVTQDNAQSVGVVTLNGLRGNQRSRAARRIKGGA